VHIKLPGLDTAVSIIQPYTSQPLVQLAIFIVASGIMIWRLQIMETKGFEGTVLGTLIMPYCSGFPNLVFAYVMSSSAKNGGAVIENCLVNNTTNLTFIIGLSALFGSATALSRTRNKTRTKANANINTKANSKTMNDAVTATKPKRMTKAQEKQHAQFSRINRLNLLFTLIAVFLFTGTLWALGKDKELTFYDGMILVGLFVFWQIMHVFEVLKDNIRKEKSIHWSIIIDLLVIAACAYGVYYSVDYLVNWMSTTKNPWLSFAKIGWFSGILMVLPNAFLAIYYAYIRRQDIVITSQVGDGHICIPMCIGLFCLFNPIHVPESFQTGIYIILGASAILFLSIAALGRVPRYAGAGLVGAYGFFLYNGLIH
jgi:cation:H+ antiporter